MKRPVICSGRDLDRASLYRGATSHWLYAAWRVRRVIPISRTVTLSPIIDTLVIYLFQGKTNSLD